MHYNTNFQLVNLFHANADATVSEKSPSANALRDQDRRFAQPATDYIHVWMAFDKSSRTTKRKDENDEKSKSAREGAAKFVRRDVRIAKTSD